MIDVLGQLAQLRRPQLLIRTARIGMIDYRRDAALHRLLGPNSPANSGEALMRLMEIEDETNLQRSIDDARYSISRHVDLLIAIMGEAQLLRLSRGP